MAFQQADLLGGEHVVLVPGFGLQTEQGLVPSLEIVAELGTAEAGKTDTDVLWSTG